MEEPTVDDVSKGITDMTISTAPPRMEPVAEHPEGEAIRRQVEYYFSDENLPTDGHMLLKTGASENLPVSIKHIMGFPKMRKYKPHTAVVESLKKCTTLDVVDNKYLKRKIPLVIDPETARERIQESAARDERPGDRLGSIKVPANQPWMTKGMLKPTGFEEYWTDTPVTPAVFVEEQQLYDPDVTFETRIETAIQRYKARRKFHSDTAVIFNSFMKYGGIDCGPKQFSGGLSATDLEEKDAAEIAAITAIHVVSGDVVGSDNWDVDFEGLAKGFLSCQAMKRNLCVSQSQILKMTNVLRNFYNYLLHHNVCPEYKEQIYAARRICDIADRELYHVGIVATRLPDSFSTNVSSLYGGSYANIFSDDQTWEGAENLGMSREDSESMVRSAVALLGSHEQYNKISHNPEANIVYEEELGFEITGVEKASDKVRVKHEKMEAEEPYARLLGKLHCSRWSYPLAPRFHHSAEAQRRQQVEQDFTLWIEDDILDNCFVGMKIEGKVCKADNGIKWLDSVRAVNPSFFELLPNEHFEKQKAMKREGLNVVKEVTE